MEPTDVVRRFVDEYQTAADLLEFNGTHRGPFQGIEPTGREVEIHVIDIVRVADGRIVEHWNCVDRLGLLAQLGALPDASAAPA
jgi:predicted ester cyclase